MSQFSGEWRAAKDLLRKTTTAVIDKTAALPISAVLQRTGLVPGGSASIQHVPGPEEQHVIPIRQQVQAPSAQGLLATCVLVLLSFMLGSWWGARHQRSRQAMLQAQAADQQTEELANISLTSTSSTDSKQLSKAHAHGVPLPDTMADSEQGQSSSNAAQHKPISAVELPEQADTGMQSAKQDSQESDDSMQQQDPTSSQESKSLTAQDDDQTALQNQDHTASRQSAPASTVHQDAHETEASSHSPNQTSFSTSALTLPWTGAAQAHHDPIGAAAGVLIQKSCQAAAVSFMQLDGKDRVGLVQQAFGIALNDHRQEQHHRSKLQENEQRAQHNALVSSGLHDTDLWRKGKKHTEQLREEQRQLAAFQNTLSDCLMCGLTVMMVALIYCGFTLGFLQGRLSACETKHRRSIWQVWSLVKAAQSVLCYGNAIGDLLISALVMLGLPWFVAKQSLLSEGVKRPMTGMILGLGVVCGAVGCFVVSRLGPNYLAWLVPYEIWIALHVLVVSKAHVLYRVLNTQQAQASLWQQSEVRMPLYLAGMGFVAPIAIAATPFWRFML